MADSDAERLIDFEIRLAYHDRTVASLDEVVRALYDRIERLEQEVRDLRRAAIEGAPQIGPANDPPPHY